MHKSARQVHLHTTAKTLLQFLAWIMMLLDNRSDRHSKNFLSNSIQIVAQKAKKSMKLLSMLMSIWRTILRNMAILQKKKMNSLLGWGICSSDSKKKYSWWTWILHFMMNLKNLQRKSIKRKEILKKCNISMVVDIKLLENGLMKTLDCLLVELSLAWV